MNRMSHSSKSRKLCNRKLIVNLWGKLSKLLVKSCISTIMKIILANLAQRNKNMRATPCKLTEYETINFNITFCKLFFRKKNHRTIHFVPDRYASLKSFSTVKPDNGYVNVLNRTVKSFNASNRTETGPGGCSATLPSLRLIIPLTKTLTVKSNVCKVEYSKYLFVKTDPYL